MNPKNEQIENEIKRMCNPPKGYPEFAHVKKDPYKSKKPLLAHDPFKISFSTHAYALYLIKTHNSNTFITP